MNITPDMLVFLNYFGLGATGFVTLMLLTRLGAGVRLLARCRRWLKGSQQPVFFKVYSGQSEPRA